MAKKDKPQKRRWWQNLSDAYKVTKRSYPWIGWVSVLLLLAGLLLGIVWSVVTHAGVARTIFHLIFGLLLGAMIVMLLLSRLVQKAFYKQLEGVKGSVSAILKGIKRGWIVYEEPVAFNKKQDVVWRMVGRPGVVLISEGPSSRARNLLRDEEKKVKRVAPKVPVHTFQVGTEKSQLSLEDLDKTLKRLKKAIGKEEVPKIDERLQALQRKGQQIPRGIDPAKMKINRRMLRGK